MKIITTTILVTALATSLASAETTQQPLPPLPTTPGYAAQPIYAPQQAYAPQTQQQPQQATYSAPAQTAAAPQAANPLLAPTPAAQQPAPQPQAAQAFAQPAFAPAPAPQTAYAPGFAPAPQPYTEAPQQQFAPAPQPQQQAAAPEGLWPSGPSVTVSKRPAATQQAFAQPAPQELPVMTPAAPQWQGQPQPAPQQFQAAQQQFQPAPQAAQQQFQPAPQAAQPQFQAFQPAAAPAPQQFQPQQQQQWQPAPAAAQFAPQAQQPQPMQQLQPASGQPAQAAIAPQPIAIPVAQPQPEPAPVQSASVAISPSVHAGTSLYMLGTISSSAPLAKASLPKDSYKTLDEDSWRQVEFVPANNSTNITNQISQVIEFKQQNWAGSGFRQVMVRPELPVSISQLGLTKTRLPKTKPTSLALRGGSVSDGFTIADAKSGWFMYGQKGADGKITSLALSPDDKPMSEAFAKQIVATAGTDLILVDWYKDTIVDTRSASTVLDWASVYKPADLVKQ